MAVHPVRVAACKLVFGTQDLLMLQWHIAIDQRIFIPFEQ
jgi:hypothetical protein